MYSFKQQLLCVSEPLLWLKYTFIGNVTHIVVWKNLICAKDSRRKTNKTKQVSLNNSVSNNQICFYALYKVVDSLVDEFLNLCCISIYISIMLKSIL